MARLRDSWRTSLSAPQQPWNPQPESSARNPYHGRARPGHDTEACYPSDRDHRVKPGDDKRRGRTLFGSVHPQPRPLSQPENGRRVQPSLTPTPMPPRTAPTNLLLVAAVALIDPDGRVLLAQ